MAEIGSSDTNTAEREIVDSLLAKLGLGALGSVRTYRGRHRNWAGTTVSGTEVFVKRIAPGSPGGARTLGRLIALESSDWAPVPRPRCLGWDADTGVLAYELVAPVRDGRRLADDGDFDEATAGRLGRLVARLHDAPCPPWLDSSCPPLPPLEELESLPVEVYRNACAAELELWRLLQGDEALTAAIRPLCTPPEAALTPVHGDLRLDQFVIGGSEVRLTDWDELRRGDPARDVGAFVGEWLFRSTLGIAAAGGTPGHEETVARGAARFGQVRPLIAAFWRAYRKERREPDADLVRRSAAFAGWHQFDRLLAGAEKQSRLLPVERAAAGIGRAVLLAPDRFATTLGLAA
ncbi:MAG TPA: class V lanthionine synthetase subunit LxmK [Amycolatopsis sp.]|uniref:Class V lanthionine synthetase subunit LxmK n=1 Tax=Amycolatopsis nalaikhensis TaxID=715472 RepID=A0ABY8XZL5_9PSEU|nr:class V lanthionine synthetase subunit LxmK [Amycolatopsis sp. 2-2]WIV61037.1 class V lanthionine synthetase subunit LxmK [Amycolatopsis sp. 2-2]